MVKRLKITLNYAIFLIVFLDSLEGFNKLNNDLSKFNLECYQHRLIKRIARFIFKIFNEKQSPSGLKNSLSRIKDQKLSTYELRNRNDFFVPSKGKYNDHMECTFVYFYSKFLNEFLVQDLNLEANHFFRRIENNVNIYFIFF